VKTITGVVYDGEYFPVSTPDEMEQLAQKAFKETSPLLLEIQIWARKNPMDLEASLDHLGTAFYKVLPTATTAAAPSTEDEIFDSADIESEYPGETQAGHTFHPASTL
jgi:hypothetical protein